MERYRFLKFSGLLLPILSLLMGCMAQTTPSPFIQNQSTLVFFYTDN